MKASPLILLCAFLAFSTLLSCQKEIDGSTSVAPGQVELQFDNVVGNRPLLLGTETYTNPFNENYTVDRFKYYISNIRLGTGAAAIAEPESYHLVDQSKNDSRGWAFAVPAGTYTSVTFLVGVDSLRNVSGAQTGALDPLNDMFWTWNSGYIMAKLEGTSPQSGEINNKIEYHLGGFKGATSVLQKITVLLPGSTPAVIGSGTTTAITITADVDAWWSSPNELRITSLPVCTTPGLQAKQIADNYANMFAVSAVVNNK